MIGRTFHEILACEEKASATTTTTITPVEESNIWKHSVYDARKCEMV